MHAGVTASVLLMLLPLAVSDAAEFECPAVTLPAVAGPPAVVAATFMGAGRYELAPADRVCHRVQQGRGETLRSYPVRGTARPRGPARRKAVLNLIDAPIDVDGSTATSVMLPETAGAPAYACYRLLDEVPTGRLCLAADVDGRGIPDAKALLCNRGRCRPRRLLALTPDVDLYAGAADASLTEPGATPPVDAVAVTTRRSVGRLDMTVARGVRDVLQLDVRLRARRRWTFKGERRVDGGPAARVTGAGKGRLRFPRLDVTAELTGAQGTVALAAVQSPDGIPPPDLGGCWLFTLTDGAALETSIRLPLVFSLNGIGASRAADETVSGSTVIATLGDGDCAVTRSGRLWCVIPSGSTEVRLFGALDGTAGAGEFAEGTGGRAGDWSAVRCP